MKTLQTKTNDPMSSLLSEIKIINEKDIMSNDLPFVRNYEEAIIYELMTLYNKNSNRKNAFI